MFGSTMLHGRTRAALLMRHVARMSSPTTASSRRLLATLVRDPNAVYGTHTLQPLTDPTLMNLPALVPPNPKYHVLRATITVSGYLPDWLESIVAFAEYTAAQLAVPLVKENLKTRIVQRWWTIKSHFIYAKKKEIFERRTHQRTFQLYDVDDKTLHFYITRLRDSLPPGIRMSVSVFDFNSIDEPPTIPPTEIMGLKLRSDTMPYPNIIRKGTASSSDLERFAKQLGAPIEGSKDTKNALYIIPKERLENLAKSNTFTDQVYAEVDALLAKYVKENKAAAQNSRSTKRSSTTSPSKDKDPKSTS